MSSSELPFESRLANAVIAVEEDLFHRHDEDPMGMCLTASLVLAGRLKDAGFDAELAYGTFELDHPDPEAWDESGDSDEPPAAAYTPPHYWVMVGNYVCDITASQFAEECDDSFSALPVICAPAQTDSCFRHNLVRLSPDYDLDSEDADWVERYRAA